MGRSMQSETPSLRAHPRGLLFGIASPLPRHFGHSRIRHDRLRVGNAQDRFLRAQPLNVPLGSLKRSSPCGTPWVGATDVGEVVGVTDVSAEELPHNSRTVGETVGVRSST